MRTLVRLPAVLVRAAAISRAPALAVGSAAEDVINEEGMAKDSMKT